MTLRSLNQEEYVPTRWPGKTWGSLRMSKGQIRTVIPRRGITKFLGERRKNWYKTPLSQSRFDAQRYWMLGAGALGWPRGMVQGGRMEEGSGWGTSVYLWRIHVDTWQNQYNTVKLKNKKKIKKWLFLSLDLDRECGPDILIHLLRYFLNTRTHEPGGHSSVI